MTNYRSLDSAYTKWIVKEYQYWTLLVNEDQRYLGRSYAWLVREGSMQRLSELTNEESEELRKLMREFERALQDLWQPDHMNYAWLGNLFTQHGGHGHMHLVPRYKDRRIFAETEFVDGRWGKNFSPSEEVKPSEETLLSIRNALKAKL